MSASVGGGHIGLFVTVMLAVLIMLLVFFYGAFIAYRGDKSKASLGMLLSIIMILLGMIVYFITVVIIYNGGDVEMSFLGFFLDFSLISLSIGMCLKSLFFIFYVKRHNKLLGHQ